jgi:hypothetical protein
MSDDGVMFPKISFARHVLRIWSTPESLRFLAKLLQCQLRVGFKIPPSLI